MTAEQRPTALKDSHLDFLDGLRISGITNMFGAVPYLQEHDPDLTEDDARGVLAYWMKTFDDRTPR